MASPASSQPKSSVRPPVASRTEPFPLSGQVAIGPEQSALRRRERAHHTIGAPFLADTLFAAGENGKKRPRDDCYLNRYLNRPYQPCPWSFARADPRRLLAPAWLLARALRTSRGPAPKARPGPIRAASSRHWGCGGPCRLGHGKHIVNGAAARYVSARRFRPEGSSNARAYKLRQYRHRFHGWGVHAGSGNATARDRHGLSARRYVLRRRPRSQGPVLSA